jgi:hypothetical protein
MIPAKTRIPHTAFFFIMRSLLSVFAGMIPINPDKRRIARLPCGLLGKTAESFQNRNSSCHGQLLTVDAIIGKVYLSKNLELQLSNCFKKLPGEEVIKSRLNLAKSVKKRRVHQDREPGGQKNE